MSSLKTLLHRARPAGETTRSRVLLAGGATAVAGVLVLSGPVSAAFAHTDGDPVVSTSETVKAELKPTGVLDVARLFSQIEATGHGSVRLEDPTSTQALRNLDGWGAPSTSDGKASYDFDVDGQKHFRTVANFTRDLPIAVNVDYALDGHPVQPEDIVGKSGKLSVTYHVKNVTAKPTEITYPDGRGKDVTESVDLVTPYVGQLAVDLPQGFDQVGSTGNRADQAGNGHGGRQLVWTMVLFEPIGQVEQTFGYTAQVDDATLPPAHIQVLPVSPANHPELKFGQDGFQHGAETGRELTAGAVKIDKNLLKLQAGSQLLLDGLVRLHAGADQLNAGLADEALPGAQQLADGLAAGVPKAIDGSQQLADGTEKAADGAEELAGGNQQLANGLAALADGAGQLQAGGHQLRAGASKLSKGFQDPNSSNDLIDGSQQLAAALGLISGGLGQLNDASSGVPAAQAGAVALKAGVDQLIAGLGSASTPNTILNGLAQLSGGNTALKNGVTQLQGGAGQLASGLPTAKGGVDQVKSGLDSALASGGDIDKLSGGVTAAQATTGCASDPQCVGTLAAVLQGIEGQSGLRAQTAAASAGLGQVSAGLGAAVSGVGAMQTGLDQVAAGLDQSEAGLTQVTGGVQQVKVGLKSGDPAHPGISEGLDRLVAGLSAAVGGLGQLAPGAAAANTGAGNLAAGIATAGDGAQQLATGANQLSAGLDEVAAKAPEAVSGSQELAVGSQKLANALANQLAPGAEQLAVGLEGLTAAETGSAELAAGLGDAASGSAQLAAGLSKEEAGQEKVVEGTGQLSSEGTTVLIASGDETSKTFGRQYAIMRALDEKGAAGALPYGAPEGSTDNRAAYDITLQGAGGPDSGSGNVGRGVAALGVLALAALAATVLRGRLS